MMVVFGFPGTAIAASGPYYEVRDLNPANTGYEAIATSINPNGQVTMLADSGGNEGYGYLYSGGSWIYLDPAFSCWPNYCYLGANAEMVNGTGQVTGSVFYGGHEIAYRYSAATGQATMLPTLGGGSADASAINAAGQVVGESRTKARQSHPFLWMGSKIIDLGTFGGPTGSAAGTYASGQAVGCAETATDAERPFLYQNGTLKDLGVKNGYTDGCANSVNSKA